MENKIKVRTSTEVIEEANARRAITLSSLGLTNALMSSHVELKRY